MRFTGKLRLLTLIACTAIASGLLLSYLPHRPAALAQQTQWPCPLKTPALEVVGIPDDACSPHHMDDFANMAWQTFKTLVWPAAGRGEADTRRDISDMVGSRVFETYKADWETFREGAAEPLVWDRYPDKAPICANADTMTPPLDRDSLVLASLHKFGNLDQIDFGSGGNRIFHILVTQKGGLVRYLTGFNKQTFNTIRANKLYGPLAVGATDDQPVPPRLFEPSSLNKTGAINIKTAWIEMDGISDPGSFHTRWAWVQRPHHEVAQRACDLKLVGLVALHIAHKTESSPQWIWASFEHVRNVPESANLTERTDYTFNDGLGTTRMDDDPPTEARFPLKKPFKVPDPYNVERRREIPKEIRDINASWQGLLKHTVWSNYKLVTVQWPKTKLSPAATGADVSKPGKSTAIPLPPCGEFTSIDVSIANSVIETFLQLDTECGRNNTCMSCHNNARNYDFIWSIPTKDWEHSKAAISLLRQAISGSRQ